MLVASQEVTCDTTKSNTGRAINNANKQKCFPIPGSKELWIKFDAYIVNGGSLRVYSEDSHGVYGVRLWHKAATDKTVIWLNDTKKDQDGIVIDGLQRYVLHIKSDATNGLVELYIDNDSKPACSFTGNVNVSDDFINFYMQSDDGNNVLYSNIIISNSIIGINENAKNENQWVQPLLSANGDFINDDFAVRKSNNSSLAYYLFFKTNGGLYFNAGQYYDIHIKNKIYIDCFNIAISYNANGVNYNTVQFTGKLLYSDDGNSYTELTSFNKNDVSNYLIIDAKHSQHHYYRFSFDTITNSSDNSVGLLRINIDGVISNFLSRNFDLSRKLSNTESVKFDLSRTVTDKQVITETFNLLRKVSRTVSESFDLKRSLSSSNFHLTESFDIARNVLRTLSETFDLSRKLSELVVQHHSTEREVYFNLVQNHSTEREVYFNLVQNHSTWRSVNGTVSIRFDTCVKSNQVFNYTGNMLSTPGGMRLASFSIEINESSVSDKITLGIANNILQPLSSVKGKLLDYDYDMLVQSTQQQGILTTVQTMLDWKKVTGTVLRYPDFDGSGKAKSSSTNQSPRVDFDYIGGELRVWATTAGSIDSSRKKPTTSASCHLDYIAQCMGYTSCEKYFDDFTPSNGCANESASYISLISNFFSWTKDIPWHEINVFGRGNTLYAVQRGHEPNTVDITTMRHTVPTVLREAVMIYKAKIKVDGDGAKVKLDVSKEDGISANKYDNYRNSYNTGNSSHSVGYDKAGRPISHKIENADGSTETIEYEYSGDSYVDRVHEIHTRTDKNGKTEVTEVWHTSIGSGREITDGSGSDGSISGSALTTNRTSDFSSTGDKLIVTASMDGNRSATYIADDTYGNYMKWTTSDDGSDSDPFPIVGGGYDYFDEIKAYNGNKVQEIRTLDIMSPVRNGTPDYKHIIDYRDAIMLDGKKYYLVSNSVNFTTVEFKQSLKIIRWE